jgi:5-methyltetrahydropteroyltriglutamate--homocysteine methyltransferase
VRQRSTSGEHSPVRQYGSYPDCRATWHGAHVNDIPLRHIIDIALTVKAQTYSFEAANVRHQHEMEVN